MADQPGAAALSECGGQACQGQDDPRSGGGADSGRGSRRVRRPTGVLGMGSSALLEMSVSMVMSVMGTTAELGRDELRSGAHMQGWSGEVPKMPLSVEGAEDLEPHWRVAPGRQTWPAGTHRVL